MKLLEPYYNNTTSHTRCPSDGRRREDAGLCLHFLCLDGQPTSCEECYVRLLSNADYCVVDHSPGLRNGHAILKDKSDIRRTAIVAAASALLLPS